MRAFNHLLGESGVTIYGMAARVRTVRPAVVAEFADSALLKVFGQHDLGLFPAPSVLEKQICRQYGVVVAGHLQGVLERFYAISVERRLKHPAVVPISDAARTTLTA